jgi:hypothetical protein
MKILLFNKAYTTRGRLDKNPCKLCVYYDTNCTHISTDICVQYGGFQTTNEEIFKI